MTMTPQRAIARPVVLQPVQKCRSFERCPAMDPCPSPSRLDDYTIHVTETLRFADTDRHGHITNSVFAVCCQTGRVAFLEDPARPLAPPGTHFILARLELDFHAEMHWPGTVDIGTRIGRVGRSSVTLAQALFQRKRCVATSRSVVVLTDQTTRRAVALPDELVVILQRLAVPTH